MKRKLIVLMGLDGSGKSTQAELLSKHLNERGIKTQAVWMRGECYLTLPLLKIGKALLRAPRETKRGEGIKAGRDYQRYVTAKHSLFRSGLLRAIWRTLTVIDRYITLKVAFSKIDKHVEVVILDRYFYDMLIDIDSAFGSGGAEMKRLLKSPLLRLFPPPDKVILLEITPEVAMKRKDDIPSMDYLVGRYRPYDMLASSINAKRIDASRAIEEVRADVEKEIQGVIE
jgi:thymidylate kinase